MDDCDHEIHRAGTGTQALVHSASYRHPAAHRKSYSQVKPTAAAPSSERLEAADEPSAGQTKHHHVGWRRAVRNVSPGWFAMTMGTGIVSLLLSAIPFNAAWIYWLAVVFLCLNTILFSCVFLASIARYTLYPEIWPVMIADPSASLSLGTFPMGFATLISAWCSLCVPYWGHWAATFAWVLWMIDSVVAVAVTIALPVLLISASERQTLDRITAVQLLPIAASMVAAAAGAQVAERLPDPEKALWTVVVSFILWGFSTPLAMIVLVMYYTRLALDKLPPRQIVFSSFLPLGPLGMGGFTITRLGDICRWLLPQINFFVDVPLAGDILFVLGISTAMVMWAFGLMWLCLALAAIYKSYPFPFNMMWWGCTFPLGVMALSTLEFGRLLPSLFFRVLGTVFACAVIVLWCVVVIGTMRIAWSGKLFDAPYLRNLPENHDEGTNRLDEIEEAKSSTDPSKRSGV